MNINFTKKIENHQVYGHITHILVCTPIETPPSVSAFEGHTLLRRVPMEATQDPGGLSRTVAEIRVEDGFRCIV